MLSQTWEHAGQEFILSCLRCSFKHSSTLQVFLYSSIVMLQNPCVLWKHIFLAYIFIMTPQNFTQCIILSEMPLFLSLLSWSLHQVEHQYQACSMLILPCSWLFTFSAKCFKSDIPDWIHAGSGTAVYKRRRRQLNKEPAHYMQLATIQPRFHSKPASWKVQGELSSSVLHLLFYYDGWVRALSLSAFLAVLSSQTTLVFSNISESSFSISISLTLPYKASPTTSAPFQAVSLGAT